MNNPGGGFPYGQQMPFGYQQAPGVGGLGVGAGGTNPGTIICHICGKPDHYARNCWQEGNRPPTQPDQETNEMREYYRRAIQREREDSERKAKDEWERRRLEDEQRKESEKLREAEAREARLEATIVRMLSQHNKGQYAITTGSPPVKKKSPRTKMKMLKEIRSYIDESEEDSEEVREEAGKLADAIESRKKAGKKKRVYEVDTNLSTDGRNGDLTRDTRRKSSEAAATKRASLTPLGIGEEGREEELKTPLKGLSAACSSEGVLEYALELHRRLSAKKVPELRKICSKEGIPWSKRDNVICELVRCRTRLVYEGFCEKPSDFSPVSEKAQGGSKKSRRKGRREMGKRCPLIYPGKVIFFSIGDKSYASLTSLFKALIGIKGSTRVNFFGGNMWSDGWRKVKSKYGESTIEMKGVKKPLKECRLDLERGGQFDVLKVKCVSSAIEHCRNYLKEILARPYRIKQAYRMDSAKLIALCRSATLFSRKNFRAKLKMKIAKVVRVKFGVDIRKRPLVKVSFSPALKSAVVRDVAAKYLGLAIIDSSIRTYLSTRVRVVVLKRRTVGDILHNHRA
ncbi:hypothetical protein CBR_g31932 [Chara braunii]|uniref:CCHC-type domain-containing protein n=1 Tax=Chara braunii TaxID=69332 RepID=A0A388LG08_CHABU|nr:hypothetical protein CBR_g31932 [Chara braunii]|eukprot:GBG81260.1 hypothetical protein CBR_g31932 [Chara braunii]